MAIIQTSDQIRYLRRKNLEEEARIVGNYYSDIVAMYGIDCVYHKKDMSEFSDFKTVIDQNAILKRAYGYDITPTYSVSTDTIAFAEVDADIFNLNKIGYTPNSDITLVFDSTRFACDLVPRIGRYREYRIDENEVVCEVPEMVSTVTSCEIDGRIISSAVSADTWPYELGLGYAETYSCGVLSGRMRCVLSGYRLGEETTVVCDPYEHTEFKVEFPKNADLYYSLKNKIQSDDYVETMLFLTFKVERVDLGHGNSRCVLRGRTHGSVLFFDLDQLGKYTSKVHPDVGDIVEIDFPDDSNREKYEITDCFDKQLTQDGISPLLHKYVWKCHARRYINSYEECAPSGNEADARLVERNEYDAAVQEQVADEISMYDDVDPDKGIKQDAAYGGYDGVVERYDKQEPPPPDRTRYEYADQSQLFGIMDFHSGSRLETDGFDLLFTTASSDTYVVAKNQSEQPARASMFDSRVKWLKATDSSVVFVDVAGEAHILVNDESTNGAKLEISIDDLYIQTLRTGENMNRRDDSFFKFDGTRTVLFATVDALYAKLASNGLAYRLA